MSTLQIDEPKLQLRTHGRDEELRDDLIRRRERVRRFFRAIWNRIRRLADKRFSLRTLLGFTLLVGIALGLVTQVDMLGYQLRYEKHVAHALEVAANGGDQQAALHQLAHAKKWPGAHQAFDPADRIVPIYANGRYAVVFQSSNSYLFEDKTITLLLINEHGDLLDRVACTVPADLWFEEYLELQVEQPESPRMAGAHFIFRTEEVLNRNLIIRKRFEYTGHSRRHQIDHGEHAYHFTWNQRDYCGMPNWETFGLCRVAIRDGRFEIVHPRLDQATDKVSCDRWSDP